MIQMRFVRGFICLAQAEGQLIPFGTNSGGGQRMYESLYTNGLTPFPNRVVAIQARMQLLKRSDLGAISLAYLEMDVAETEEEITKLATGDRFAVVVRLDKNEYRLLGRPVEGKPEAYPLPGADLRDNEMQTWPSLEVAVDAARDTARQTMSWTTVAAFRLKRL